MQRPPCMQSKKGPASQHPLQPRRTTPWPQPAHLGRRHGAAVPAQQQRVEQLGVNVAQQRPGHRAQGGGGHALPAQHLQHVAQPAQQRLAAAWGCTKVAQVAGKTREQLRGRRSEASCLGCRTSGRAKTCTSQLRRRLRPTFGRDEHARCAVLRSVPASPPRTFHWLTPASCCGLGGCGGLAGEPRVGVGRRRALFLASSLSSTCAPQGQRCMGGG